LAKSEDGVDFKNMQEYAGTFDGKNEIDSLRVVKDVEEISTDPFDTDESATAIATNTVDDKTRGSVKTDSSADFAKTTEEEAKKPEQRSGILNVTTMI